MNSYLTYRLGDNDFRSAMQHALEWMLHDFGLEFIKSMDDSTFLAAMANHMAGEVMARSAIQHSTIEGYDFKWYYEYFVSATIDRTEEGAHADGNWSYISININTGYVWIH